MVHTVCYSCTPLYYPTLSLLQPVPEFRIFNEEEEEDEEPGLEWEETQEELQRRRSYQNRDDLDDDEEESQIQVKRKEGKVNLIPF